MNILVDSNVILDVLSEDPHWFAWSDQSITGRMDGENYSFGFIDVTDRASPDFIEGVVAAITGKDFPHNTGIYMVDQFIFAMEKARFVGEPPSVPE